MSMVAIGASVTAAAAIASTAYAMSQSPPGAPSGNASAAAVQAQAEMLPWQRRYEAAAAQGGQVVNYGYNQTTRSAVQRAQMQTQLDQLNQQITQQQQQRQNGNQSQGGWLFGTVGGPFGSNYLTQQRDQLQRQIAAIPEGGGTVYTDGQGNIVPRSTAVTDFSGYGQGQVQGQLAQQMARVQLGLQQKYGVDFANQARQEIAQSDPEGTQARQELYNLIEQQNNETPDRPVANMMDRQVQQQLDSGNRLDPVMRDVLNREVAKAQAARGQDAGADTQQFATPMETGFEGQQRQLAAQQKAIGWLSSGTTPEDVQYRREQQNLSNLGSFVNGQTPEAQFRNLSGAQQGATPFNPGAQLPQAQPGADQTGLGYSTAGYLQNLRFQGSQANPWMAGLTGLLSAAGTANRAGLFGGTTP